MKLIDALAELQRLVDDGKADWNLTVDGYVVQSFDLNYDRACVDVEIAEQDKLTESAEEGGCCCI